MVSTGFQAGWCHTVWAWCLPSLVFPEDLSHIFFTGLKYRSEGEGVAGGVNGCVERWSGWVWGISNLH